MLTGVIADTHDNIPMVRAAMGEFADRDVERVIHAGDFVAPFTMKALLEPGLPLIGVFGNNDGERKGLKKLLADLYEPPHRFELGGRTIVLTHDEEDVSDQMAQGADVVIFGHTHEVVVEEGPPLRLNPGEAGGWLHGQTTAALLELDDMDVEIIDLQPESQER